MSGIISNRPSIFIIWSEDILRRSIRRALKFMIRFLSSNDLKFHNLERNFDEYFLLFDLILQWSYLHRWQASFTEHYFSLKRSPFGQQSDMLKSLLQLCLMPYAMEKLDNYYEKIHEHHMLTKDLNNGQHKIILHYYPFVRKFVQLIRLFVWLSYATDGDHYPHCPSFVFFWPATAGRMKLVHSMFKDEIPATNFLSKLSYLMSSIFSLTFRSGAFAIQFLDYWNTRTDLRQMFNFQHSPDLPPPISDNKNLSRNHSMSSDLCPICGLKRQNETALTSSGYVFCYTCIHSYLNKNHRCPITGFPSELEQLVRIFS